jgi:hypothetical protein
MSNCGCKDPNESRDILPAMLQDGEAVIPAELAEKYRQSVREQKIKVNSVNNDQDLEARNRMLEAELALWKESYNELSEEYVSLVGGEDFKEPNYVPPLREPNYVPEKETVKVVMEYHLDVVVDKGTEIQTCDVFDTVKFDIQENPKLSIDSVKYGVISIGDTVFPRD